MNEKKIIIIPLKFVVYKFERSAAPLMGIWISNTSDRIRRWTFCKYSRDSTWSWTCSSCFLLFWSNLFNYSSLSSIFGKFQIFWFIMSKPLCFHARGPGSIPWGVHSTRSPYLLTLLGQLSLLSCRGDKWALGNTGAISGSSTTRITPINHHWWYDRRLSTYHSGSVGRTMSTKLTEPRFRYA